ncbi:MAG: RagB/SusD family nutrient uptake outer membrane protein [Prevotella sp.]|jgi:hypothetical protein|nr:RagB/SusD family nutrient uptake outer membrane protein [Prevotella sp.]
MKIYKIIVTLLAACFLNSCSDYLDIVPDNLATLDIAFNNRSSAEQYLYTCYSYVPSYGDQSANPGIASGNEIWYYTTEAGIRPNRTTNYIAYGLQNSSEPIANYWDGEQQGKPLFQALRDCNIFLEYMSIPDRVHGLRETERLRWLAEVNVLKAFYHYFLFQLYGPIPIIDKNLTLDASIEETRVSRQKVDEVVKYIVDLIDNSYRDLPLSIAAEGSEMGRLTQPAALAIKAKVLLLAASPLFNGNTDLANFKDHDGRPFFNQTYDKSKWILAAEAALEAIELAEANGHGIYYFSDEWPIDLPDELSYGMNVRGAVTHRFTKELIWSIGKQSTYDLQCSAVARLTPSMQNANSWSQMVQAKGILAPTLATVERFYSRNGVPIEEDKDWIENNNWYIDRYKFQTIGSDNKYVMKEGARTAILHFNREYRFYGFLGFDGATWYGSKWKDPNGTPNYIQGKKGEYGGIINPAEAYSVTGYFSKKVVPVEYELDENGAVVYEYPFPIVRLADLYLMYAEALNESTDGETVNPEIYKYLDIVRERSGLEGVVKSWDEHSINKNKPKTVSGMREIIRQERSIELALEGHYFFDIRRWKLANKEFIKPIQGWNIWGLTNEDYYQVTTIYIPKMYQNKQYFWPIKDNNIVYNPNLIQSYGW